MNVLEIYGPVRSAIKAIIDLHKAQTNPEYIIQEKAIIHEIVEDLDQLYSQLEMAKDEKSK